MQQVNNKMSFWWSVFCIFVLSSCRTLETYSNADFGYTFEHPHNWKLEKEDETSIVFFEEDVGNGNSIVFFEKGTGDATIWIRVFNEPSAPTASESLLLQNDNWIVKNNIEILTDFNIAAQEHPSYDVATSQFTIQSFNSAFQINFYNIVIQTPTKMAVIFIGGDSIETIRAGETILNSFKFLPSS